MHLARDNTMRKRQGSNGSGHICLGRPRGLPGHPARLLCRLRQPSEHVGDRALGDGLDMLAAMVAKNCPDRVGQPLAIDAMRDDAALQRRRHPGDATVHRGLSR